MSVPDQLPPFVEEAAVEDVAGLWSPERRQLTIGLVLTITLVAFESLAIATVMPDVKDDLGGLGLYGWVFSGFFLASILGIVVSGQLADRRGLAMPFTAGLILFGAGLAVGGAAQSMEMLVFARLAQGFGAGAVPAVAYAAIGRGYPASLRPRMFATTSTAWVVPGLIGPAVATLIEHALSWRWVFLLLLPIVVVAAVMILPALRALGVANEEPVEPETTAADREVLRRVVILVAGVGAVLGAGTGPPLAVAVALVVIGAPLAVWAFLGLVPAGTIRLRPGVPATIGVRGILTWAFFSADAYVPLALHDGRGAATWVAGLALSACSVLWATGSWAQARFIERYGPRTLDRAGFLVIILSIASLLAVSRGAPVGIAVVAWGASGFGMGLAYSPLSLTVLAAAKPGDEGSASASLQLSDTLGVSLGIGLGGWIVALGDHHHWEVDSSTTIVFLVALAVGTLGLLAAGRLPRTLPDGPLD